jgi:hypothetical protein
MRKRGKALAGALAATVCGLAAAFMFLPDSSEKTTDTVGAAESSGDVERSEADNSSVNETRTDGILSAIAGEQRLERRFVDEISAVEAALSNLEASHTFEGSGFLHDGTIGWGAEIDDLHRRLTAVEDALAVPTSSEGEF